MKNAIFGMISGILIGITVGSFLLLSPSEPEEMLTEIDNGELNVALNWAAGDYYKIDEVIFMNKGRTVFVTNYPNFSRTEIIDIVRKGLAVR